MPYACSMKNLSTVYCHLVRMSSTASFLICLFRSLSALSAFLVSFIGERFGCCRQGWLDVSSAAGRNEGANGLIHCFPEGILGVFDSSCFASFSKVIVVGFSITCTVRFLEVDVGSPRPIDRR